MSNSFLKERIIDSYDETMKDYLESEDRKSETYEWNKWYFSFCKKLSPELCQEFEELLRADEDMMQATAEEALYRGVMLGIVESGKVFK